jgi:hypothetical protein
MEFQLDKSWYLFAAESLHLRDILYNQLLDVMLLIQNGQNDTTRLQHEDFSNPPQALQPHVAYPGVGDRIGKEHFYPEGGEDL